MRPIKNLTVSRLHSIQIVVSLLLLGFFHVSAYSQASSSSGASLRGTVKLGTVAVEDVKVLIVAPKRLERVGSPVPARSNKLGEYRIGEIRPGKYELRAKAVGLSVAKLPVAIEEGNSNIFNITLQRPGQTTKVRGKLLDKQNQPVKNKKVLLYSNELPPTICPECSVGEADPNEQGEVTYEDLASDELYTFAIKMDDKDPNASNLIISAPMVIGSNAQTSVELKFSDDAKPVLTASLLQAPAAPQEIRKIRDPESYAFWMPDMKHYQTQKLMEFKFGSATSELSSEAKRVLDEIATDVEETDRYVLAIGPSADSVETFQANPGLSERQAAAIVNYLVKTRGIRPERVVTSRAFSETKAMGTAGTIPGDNRVVEIFLLVDKGKLQEAARPRP